MTEYKILFWDFDGVIKDSLDVKTRAFTELFTEFGKAFEEKVRDHHLAHGGMSRFQKIPLYAKWAGVELTDVQIQEYSAQFSKLAFQGVLDAPWVPGAEDYLRRNPYRQTFILVSATPEDELGRVVSSLGLNNIFEEIHGSPCSKNDAISSTLQRLSVIPDECLMIGDARADMDAALANNIDFLLRRHETNVAVFRDYSGPSVNDFLTV